MAGSLPISCCSFVGIVDQFLPIGSREVLCRRRGCSPARRRRLEAVYKLTHNNTLDGLDDIIKKAKDELAAPPAASPPPAA